MTPSAQTPDASGPSLHWGPGEAVGGRHTQQPLLIVGSMKASLPGTDTQGQGMSTTAKPGTWCPPPTRGSVPGRTARPVVPLGFTQPWARVSRGPHPPLQDHVLPSHREGDLCPAEPPTPCRQSTCSEGSRPEKAGPWGGWGCGLQAQQLLCPDQGCPSSSCPSGAPRLPALACSESQVSSDRRAPLPALLTPGWAEGPLRNGDS